MSEEFFKLNSDLASAEADKDFPSLKAATGEMKLELIKGANVEKLVATSFYMGAVENRALLYAHFDDKAGGRKVKLDCYKKLEAGKSYKFYPHSGAELFVWFVDNYHDSVGTGILNVEKILMQPPEPYIKGSFNFECEDTSGSGFMTVVVKDFWIKGDMS